MSTLNTNTLSARAGTGTINVPTGNTLYAPGHIIQVVQTVKTDTFSAAPGANTFAAVTGYTGTITPKSINSKILVCVDLYVGMQGYQCMIKLFRDATFIGGGTAVGSRPSVTFYQNTYPSASPQYQCTRAGGMYLDSPATTSAITYSVQIKDYTTNTVYVNRSHAWQNTTDYDGAGSSFLTLMEVAA